MLQDITYDNDKIKIFEILTCNKKKNNQKNYNLNTEI